MAVAAKYAETRTNYITAEYLRSEQARMVEADPYRRKGRNVRKAKLARRQDREARAEMDW
jgi:hypothetical protein